MAPLPTPEPGLVISYGYLWRYEWQKGAQEGRKSRPCVIILATRKNGDDLVATVAAITHTPPDDESLAIELPAKVKHNLSLDTGRSWVILNEVNEFTWPGYDLRPIPGHQGQYQYGFLPWKLYDRIRNRLLDLLIQERAAMTNRD